MKVNKKIISTMSGISLLCLGACATPGVEDRPDVYNAGQVNQAQQVETVTIVGVSPARVQVDNRRNQRTATAVGAVLGVGLGAGLGAGVGGSALGGALAGLGGGAAGGYIGNQIEGNTTLTSGVTVFFKTPSGQELSSTQVGKICEYQPGPATLIATGPGVTRVQPNASCPTR